MMTEVTKTAKSDASALVLQAFLSGLKPDPVMPISEWSEKYRFLASESSPFPGPWRNSMVPHLAEIVDCLAPHNPCNRIAFLKSSQVAGSEGAINAVLAIADMWPGPIGYFLPTVNLARQFNETKLDPAIKASPRIRKVIKAQKSRDETGSTTLRKKFAGGYCVIKGASSAAELEMLSLKYLVKDELSSWVFDLDGKGDPSKLVDKRVTAFEDHKIFELGVPGVKGSCRITDAFEGGDQRLRFVPCPDCGEMQPLEFGRMRYNDRPPYDPHYACCACGSLIPEHKRDAMLDAGEWRAQVPGPGRYPSFKISQLYSKFVSWDRTIAEYFEAKGKPQAEKKFSTHVLAEAYEEKGDAPPAEQLLARRSDYHRGRVPHGVLFLTGAADVQGNRIEWAVYGWGRGFTSYLIDWGVIEGDPVQLLSREGQARALTPVLARKYTTANGWQLGIDLFGIDTGYLTSHVYDFVRRHAKPGQLKALDGRHGDNLPPIGTPKKQDVDFDGRKLGSLMLWPVGTWGMKSELYAGLRLTIAGADADGNYPEGLCYFPQEVDIAYFQQLTAETYALAKTRDGLVRGYWKKLSGQPNEAHDIAVYSRALAHFNGDRLSPADWDALEALRLAPPEQQQRNMEELWGAAEQTPAPVEQQAPKQAPWVAPRSNWLGKN